MKTFKNYSGIYLITNLLTKKVYVGSSKGCMRRMQTHRNKLRANKHCNSHLQNAWNLQNGEHFSYSVIEQTSPLLTKQELEKIETKWILYYKAHQSAFGYNATLPGSIPLYREEENRTRKPLIEYVYINISTGEIGESVGTEKLCNIMNTRSSKIIDAAAYWEGKGKIKSLHGYIVVRKETYLEDFDYIGYKRKRIYTKPKTTKTWKDYVRKPYIKKSPKDIIPHSERNLKRIPIIAVNISTGEEKQYASIKEASDEFMEMKVRKCVNAPFGKYKHRGFYFRKA